MRKKQEPASSTSSRVPDVEKGGQPLFPSRRHDTGMVDKARKSNLNWARRKHERKAEFPASAAWKRETWTLPRDEARAKAREFLRKYPKAAYWSELESWRVLPGDRIEFTMRRLPSAD